jgi:hypothetical protein
MSGGYWWSICGLTSDIIGASLLAVEAIKLENLRKLAEEIRLRVELPLQSPLFKPSDPESEVWEIPATELRAMGFGHRDGLYTAAHIVSGWFGLVTIDLLVRATSSYDIAIGVNSWIVARNLWLALALYLLLAIFFGLAASWLIGEFIIHRLIGGSARGAIKLLSYIDRNTPNGTTGIIGFVFMFFGFVGQIVATIVNG